MAKLTISVITPCLNPGEKLRRAVESVRQQCYSLAEHIVVDGGSTDGTVDWLSQCEGVKWISEPDGGQADAMNKGFRMASGDVVVYLNADDYFLPGAFEAVAEEFLAGHQFVMGNVLVKQIKEEREWLNTPKTDFQSMLRHWEEHAFCVNPVGYFYRREVQETVPFNTENRYAMDLEFLLNASLKFPIQKIDYTLGVFEYAADCKTGQAQSLPAYWNPESFPYIELLANEHLTDERREQFFKQRDLGYQQRRRWVAESFIGTDIFEELIESGEIIMMPKSYVRMPWPFAQMRMLPYDALNTRGDIVVAILQAAKCASTAICESLDIANSSLGGRVFDAYHLHHMDPNAISRLIRLKLPNSENLHGQLAIVHGLVRQQAGLTFKIITPFREPIAAAMSSIFEQVAAGQIFQDSATKALDLNQIKKMVIDVAMTRALFFERELQIPLGVNVFSQPFAKERGWSIQKHRRAEVLLLRYEDIERVYSQAMESFLGISRLSLPRANVTAEKGNTISTAYEEVKAKLRFDASYLNEVYSHPSVRHFYTDEQIAGMRAKWEDSPAMHAVSQKSIGSDRVGRDGPWHGTIYNIGLNTGQDSEFYLKKGFRVIAVEASPDLASAFKDKFPGDIESGQLVVVNAGIVGEERAGETLSFYYNEYMTEWGSFDKNIGWRSIQPYYTAEQDTGGRKTFAVPCTTLAQLMEQYGDAYYVKIDIEGYDIVALNSLLAAGKRPAYISVKNGGAALLDLLRNANYDSFKMVSQRDVREQRVPCPAREGDWAEHEFPFGASGMFGEESPGEWLDFDAVNESHRPTEEAMKQGQWYDLHARHSTHSFALNPIKSDKPIVVQDTLDFLSPENFKATISRKSHMSQLLQRYDDDVVFARVGGHSLCDLKRYSDLMTYAFIRRNIPPGSKLLEIGGGYSRVLSALADEYECWNLDKFEGLGNGPTTAPNNLGFRLVQDYIGNFSSELPDKSFDFVFSISVLEHVPEVDVGWFENIIADIARVACPGSYSLHCVDSIITSAGTLWLSSIVPYIARHVELLPPVEDWMHADSEGDLHFVSRESYDCAWKPYTKKSYEEWGRPFGQQLLWRV